MLPQREINNNVLIVMYVKAEVLEGFSRDLYTDAETSGQVERAEIAFTKVLADTVEYWIHSLMTASIRAQDTDQSNREEVIRKLDYAIRTLRHTK